MLAEEMSFEELLEELGRRYHQLKQRHTTLVSYAQMLCDKLTFERETMKALGAVEFDLFGTNKSGKV